MTHSRFSPVRRQLISALATGAATVGFPQLASAAVNEQAAEFPRRLHRGVSLSDWFQYSQKSKVSSQELIELRRRGMDHVRLPIDPFFLGWRPDSAADQPMFTKLGALDDAIRNIINAGLILNLDFHPGTESIAYLQHNQGQLQSTLNKALVELVRRYKTYGPEKICFELMNEPHRFVASGKEWNTVQGNLIDAVRREAPDHWLIANGVWDPLSIFRTLNVYPQSKIMYSFHFYKPYVVTHQGAKWEPSAARLFPYLDHVPYPSRQLNLENLPIRQGGDKEYLRSELAKYKNENWNAEKILAEMHISTDWALTNKVPIICTEFGVMKEFIAPESREKWLSDVTTAFEKNNIPWTAWDYCDNFGIADRNGTGTFIPEATAKALKLKA